MWKCLLTLTPSVLASGGPEAVPLSEGRTWHVTTSFAESDSPLWFLAPVTWLLQVEGSEEALVVESFPPQRCTTATHLHPDKHICFKYKIPLNTDAERYGFTRKITSCCHLHSHNFRFSSKVCTGTKKEILLKGLLRQLSSFVVNQTA